MIKKEQTQIGKLIKNTKIYEPKRPTNEKAIKLEILDESSVTISSGDEFNSDELSQNRMQRALFVMNKKNINTINWKLLNNEVKEVTFDELLEALQLAGEQQTQIWFN